MYRVRGEQIEMLLVHLGGPFWRNKDERAWFVPKGEVEPGEEGLAAARREFTEETGLEPRAPYIELGTVRKSGKLVTAWAFEGDCDVAQIRSNTFRMEWPPKSGVEREFPEVDQAQFFTLDTARHKASAAELPLLERLVQLVR
jgi:predicted NUDIX family NTP pyrophosphohydrolase